MGLLGKIKLITIYLQGLVEMCKLFNGVLSGSAEGREGESGQNKTRKNGKEVA